MAAARGPARSVAALQDEAIGLIGAGSLAGALVRGLVAAGLDPGRLWVCNRGGQGLDHYRRLGAHATRSKQEVAAAANHLLLLVKPKDAPQALAELAPHFHTDHRLLSCVAGLPTAYLEQALGPGARVLRAMPNVAAEVRASATGLAAGLHALPGDVDAAHQLLEAVGTVVVVPESRLDAVTAVAGSGPAYIFLLMEAMLEAARTLDLPPGTAEQLVRQTALGAALLADHAGRTPGALRESVTSPGGTTEAALAVLRDAGFTGLVGDALRRAAVRSAELGRAWAVPGRALP